MDRDALRSLLDRLSRGECSVDETLERLKFLPFEDVGVACIDHHRALRRGNSEVIFAQGKSLTDIAKIMESMAAQGDNILVTRLTARRARDLCKRFPGSQYHARAQALTRLNQPAKLLGRGPILIVSAGSSDIPVAEEARVTAEFMANEVQTIYDVGISGLHRILEHRERLLGAAVLVVVAGMEGALPSVVAGLVEKPVIAVPTSVGYGASFQGLAALLGMLNSCASGVTVVNIDNGFGAGYAAALINRV